MAIVQPLKTTAEQYRKRDIYYLNYLLDTFDQIPYNKWFPVTGKFAFARANSLTERGGVFQPPILLYEGDFEIKKHPIGCVIKTSPDQDNRDLSAYICISSLDRLENWKLFENDPLFESSDESQSLDLKGPHIRVKNKMTMDGLETACIVYPPFRVDDRQWGFGGPL